MNDKREAIRVVQPDGTIKIVFRDKKTERVENHKEESVKPETPGKQEEKHKDRKKIEPNSEQARYYNPLVPGHIDIFGKDLLNKDLIFYLLGGETIHGKMTGYAIYEILVEADNKKFIVMKPAIQKIEVL